MSSFSVFLRQKNGCHNCYYISTKHRWNFTLKIDSKMTLSENSCFNGIFAPVKLWLKRFLNAF